MSTLRYGFMPRRDRRRLAGGYAAKVLGTGPIAYWPLDEGSGAVARCLVNPAQNGAYTGVTLANDATGPFGTPAPYFDAANDEVDVYSAALAAAFDGAVGSIAVWAKVSAVGVWTDLATRMVMQLRVDANNYVRVYRDGTDNEMRMLFRSGGGNSNVNIAPIAPTGWEHYAITWDKAANQMKAYYQGAQFDVTQGIAVAWAGALAANNCFIGAGDAGPLFVWDGYIAHPALWDRALGAGEIATLANP